MKNNKPYGRMSKFGNDTRDAHQSTRKAVEDLYIKYKRRAADSLSRGNDNAAAFYIERAAVLMYNYNLIYEDDDLEDMLQLLSEDLRSREKFFCITYPEQSTHVDRVTIIDSFGLSFRGLAWIYSKGLVDIGYKLQYVVSASAKNSSNFQPLRNYLESSGVSITYIIDGQFDRRVKNIVEEIAAFSPSSVFFHGTPWDITSLAAICMLSSNIATYQVNLTDHAFWLGASAFDHYIEFRDYGATISAMRRGISRDKLALLSYYPVQLITTDPFQGLPFDDGSLFFVSGGAAYKTEGKPQFPELVNEVLNKYPNINFLFLSNTKPNWFDRLAEAFPDRVFLLEERRDLVEIIKRSQFYLNTYPMYGALMTQIAAACGRVPITLLLEGSEPAAMLLSRKVNKIDFSSISDAIAEIDKLLEDGDYCHMRNEEMAKSVDGPKEFACNLKLLMSGEAKTPSLYAELNDARFLSSYLARGSGRFDPAKISFCRECLRHRTVFDIETWVGLMSRIHDRLLKRRTKD